MAFEERKCDVSLVRGKCVTLAQDIGIYDENKRICSEYKKVSGEKKGEKTNIRRLALGPRDTSSSNAWFCFSECSTNRPMLLRRELGY